MGQQCNLENLSKTIERRWSHKHGRTAVETDTKLRTACYFIICFCFYQRKNHGRRRCAIPIHMILLSFVLTFASYSNCDIRENRRQLWYTRVDSQDLQHRVPVERCPASLRARVPSAISRSASFHGITPYFQVENSGTLRRKRTRIEVF